MGRNNGDFEAEIKGDKLHIKGQKPIQLYLTPNELSNPPKKGYEYTGKNPNDE